MTDFNQFKPPYKNFLKLKISDLEAHNTIINDQILAVNKELSDAYFYTFDSVESNSNKKLHLLNNEEASELIINSDSPHLKFLLKKYYYLKHKQKGFDQTIHLNHLEIEKPKKRSVAKYLFNVGKKIFDSVDDLWTALKGLLPLYLIELVSPILIGSIGFVIHFFEGFGGLKQAYHAYKNEQTPQRKTRIVAGVLTSIFAGVGIGLSITLLAAAAGVAVASEPLLPMLIPTFLTAIYSVALWKKTYIYTQAKRNEAIAKSIYDDCIEKNQAKLITFKNACEQKLTRKELNDLGPNWQNECAEIQGQIDAHQQTYHYFQDMRFKAGLKIGFSVLEVLTSATILTFTILGATALLTGLGVGSFGIVPLVVGCAVVIGASAKAFEEIDARRNHTPAKNIKNWFEAKWNNLFHPRPTLYYKCDDASVIETLEFRNTTAKVFTTIPPSKNKIELEEIQKPSAKKEITPVAEISAFVAEERMSFNFSKP